MQLGHSGVIFIASVCYYISSAYHSSSPAKCHLPFYFQYLFSYSNQLNSRDKMLKLLLFASLLSVLEAVQFNKRDSAGYVSSLPDRFQFLNDDRMSQQSHKSGRLDALEDSHRLTTDFMQVLPSSGTASTTQFYLGPELSGGTACGVFSPSCSLALGLQKHTNRHADGCSSQRQKH